MTRRPPLGALLTVATLLAGWSEARPCAPCGHRSGALRVRTDCNGNGVDDGVDISSGASADCNANGVPDECDVSSGSSADLDADGVPDECSPPPLGADVLEVSATDGGTQNLALSAGVEHAGNWYLMLGSAGETAPGVAVDGVVLPLEVDEYLLYTLLNPNSPVLSNTLGTLDASGAASAAVNLPAGLGPASQGLVLKHAYVVFGASGGATFASNPVPLLLAAPADGLTFTPEPGIRADHAAENSAVRVGESGTTYLFYNHKLSTTGPGQDHVATSTDGLEFTDHHPPSPAEKALHPKLLLLPEPDAGGDSILRRFIWKQFLGEMHSESSTDGTHFTPDPGVRYYPHASADPLAHDHDKIGIHHFFNRANGDVVMLYIGDMNPGGHNNVRRAISTDNGENFSFDAPDVLGDAALGGGNQSHVDQVSIELPDGRRRLFTMNQHRQNPIPGQVSTGTVHSFISDDEGETWTEEPGARLHWSDFTEFSVYSLNDPFVLRLPDGRYRMYVTALVEDDPVPGSPPAYKPVIVSAITRGP